MNPRQYGYVKIGAQLPEDLKKRSTELLENNADLFAWVSTDMPGIDPSFMCHRLAIEPTTRPMA